MVSVGEDAPSMDPEAGRQFEERVRAAMAAAGISSLSELARASGIKTQVWYSWFRGEKRPRMNSLRLAAQALHTTPGALMDVVDEPEGKERGEAPEDLASAIRVQADSISELAAALRDRDALMTELLQALAVVQAEQSNQVATNSATIESLRVVLGRLVERDDPAAPTPATRRGTGG